MRIETPVSVDAEGDYVDATGALIFIGSVMPTPVDAEVVKRINLYDGLVSSLRAVHDLAASMGHRARDTQLLERSAALLDLAGGDQSTAGYLTFDDEGFGWTDGTYCHIKRRGAPRPPGFASNVEWYAYAKSVVSMISS